MLAAALMPTLAQALAQSRGDTRPWAQVCTPQGMKRVALDASASGESSAPLQAGGAPGHCTLCTAAGAVGLPPAPAGGVYLLGASAELPAQPEHPRAPGTTWCGAQPRAPPAAV